MSWSCARVPLAAGTLLALASALCAPLARAEDWLAAYPECDARARASAPGFELLYPRPGLPALIEAGDTLLARVRLPAPLTPPPGIQQPRALVGWRAQLIGRALALPDGSPAELRQALEVTGVRPDGARSLLYRASIPIPAWIAPGTYDLFLAAPGGEGVAHAALRVLERGRAPRLAWSWDASASFERSALPVDAWLLGATTTAPVAKPAAAAGGREDAPELMPAPSVDLQASVAALRVGRALWLLGSCRDDASYEAELRGLAAREGRSIVRPVLSAMGPAFQPLGGNRQPWPAPGALRLARDERSLLLDARADYPADAELPLRLPGGTSRVALEGGSLTLFPSGEIASERAPGALGILRVSRGAQARIELAGATPLRARLEAPAHIPSGRSAQLRVLGAPSGARVAWRLSPLETAFGPATIEHRFIPLGEHRVVALVLAPGGGSQRIETRIRCVTQQASSCAASRAQGSPSRPLARGLGLLLLYGGSCLRRRRKENAARNARRE